MKKLVFYISILLVSSSINAQVEEQWDLTVDSYQHNSSNYSAKNPAIETTILSNHDIVIFTQNGTFIKTDSVGNIIWKKTLKQSTRQRIISDKNDNIFLIRRSKIEKYNSEGKLIWSKDYSKILNRKDLLLTAFTSDNKNNIYVSSNIFYTTSILIFKIDNDGTVHWHKKIKQKIPNWHYLDECKEIIYHNDNIYALQYTNRTHRGSIINLLTSEGKKLKKYNFNYHVKQIKAFNDFIYTVGNTGSIQNDSIKIKKFNNNFVLTDSINFKLPRNMSYSKEATKYFSFAITKEEYEKRYITSYHVSDFVIDPHGNYYIVGAKNGQWILKLNNKGVILDNKSNFNKKYHNYDKGVMDQAQEISTIMYCKGNIILTGVSSETDYSKKLFMKNINLFLKVIKAE